MSLNESNYTHDVLREVADTIDALQSMLNKERTKT